MPMIVGLLEADVKPRPCHISAEYNSVSLSWKTENFTYCSQFRPVCCQLILLNGKIVEGQNFQLSSSLTHHGTLLIFDMAQAI